MAENLGRAVLEIDIDDSALEKGLKKGKGDAQAFVNEVKQLFAQIKLNVDATPLMQSVRGVDSALKSMSQTVKEDGTVLNSFKFETEAAAQSIQKMTQAKVALLQEAATFKTQLQEEAAAQKEAIAAMKADEYAKTAQVKRDIATQTAALKMRLMEEKAASQDASKGLEAIKSIASSVGSGLQSLASHAGSAGAKLLQLGGEAAGVAASGLGKVASATGGAIAGLAKLSAVGGAALGAVGVAGVKSAASLEESVNNISSIAEVNKEQVFAALNQMSTRVPQSAAQLGDSLYNVFSSFSTNQAQALRAVEGFAKGAVAAQTDASTFGTSIMGVLNAYGQSLDDAGHVQDVFFATVKNGVINGQELASSLGPVTQAAKAAGVNFDELGAMIAGVTKEGGPAAQNVNNLNNFLQKVTTKEAQAQINQLGIKTKDAAGNFRPTLDVLGDLKTKLNGMTEAQRANALQAIFPDAQARQGAATLMSQLDNVKGFLQENIKASGDAEEAYKKMVSGFSAQGKLLVNTFKATLTTIGGALLPVLTPVVQGLTSTLQSAQPQIERFANSLASGVSKGIGEVAKAFQGIKAGFSGNTFAEMAASANGIPAIFMKIGSVIRVAKDSVITFIGALKGNWEGEAGGQVNRFTLMIGNLGLFIRDLINRFGPLIGKFFELKEAINPLSIAFSVFEGFLNGGIGGAIDAFKQKIIDIGKVFGVDLTGPIDQATGIIQTTVLPIFTTLGNIFEQNLKPAIMTFVQQGLPPLSNILGTIASLLNDPILPVLGQFAAIFIGSILPNILKVVDTITSALQPVIQQIGNIIQAEVLPRIKEFSDWFEAEAIPVIQDAANVIGGVLAGAFQLLGPIIGTALDFGINGFKIFFNIFKDVFNGVKDGVGIVQGLFTDFGGTAKEVWSAIGDAISNAWNTVSGIFNNLKDAVGNALTNAFTTLQTTAGQVWDAITNAVSNAVNSVKQKLDEAISAVGDLPKNALSALGDVGSTLTNAGKQLIQGFIEGVKSMAKSVMGAVSDVLGGIPSFAQGLLGIHSPSKVMADQVGKPVGEGVAVGIAQSAKSAIQAMLDLAKGLGDAGTDAALKHSKNIADTAKGVADSISATMKAFSALQGFKGGLNVSGLNVLIDGLNVMVATFEQSAVKFGAKGLEAAKTYSEGAGKVVSIIKSAVDGLNALAKYKPVAEANVHEFMQGLAVLVGDFVTQAANFKADGVTAAGTWAESVGKMVSLIANGVKGFEALQDYKGVATEALDLFTSDLSLLAGDMVGTAEQFDEEGIKAAATYAESVGKMVSIIGNGVKGFAELQNYKGASVEAVDLFTSDLMLLAGDMLGTAEQFEEDSLKAGTAFAEGVGKMVSLIKPAIDGFTALQTFKGVAAKSIDLFMADTVYTAQKMQEASQLFDQEALPGVNKFADSISKITGALKGALDFFKELDSFKGIMPNILDWLAFDIGYSVGKMTELATKTDQDGLASALDFSESVSKLFGLIKPALDVFKQLSDQKTAPMAGVDALVTGVTESVKKLSAANAQALAFQQLAQQFASNIVQGLTLIGQATGSALTALQPLAGAGGELPALPEPTGAGAGLDTLPAPNLPALPAVPSNRALSMPAGAGAGAGGSFTISEGAIVVSISGAGLDEKQLSKLVKTEVKEALTEVVKNTKSNRNYNGK